MILKSRQQTKWTDRVKNFFWPRKSYWRSLQYFGKRILRIHATPHALALGFAIGVFAAFTPPGIHVPLAVLIAWVVDANMISAALATAISNPFTFIPIGALDLKVGDWFFGHHTGPQAPLENVMPMMMHLDFGGMWAPFFKPFLFGSVLLGVASAIPAYCAVYFAAKSFEKNKRQRVARKAVAAEQ